MDVEAFFIIVSLIATEVAPVAGPSLGAPHQAAAAYENQFGRAFPLSGDTHRIVDWDYYVALASGDVVEYALHVNADLAKRAENAKGRPYQTQLLDRQIRNDSAIASTFEEQRTRLQQMMVSASAAGVSANRCDQAIAFVDNEFRLVLGEGSGSRDPLSHSVIAPECHLTPSAAFQLTAGRSRRFVCWPDNLATKCGWRLNDMPTSLKAVVEGGYPATLALRWRWRGLGTPVHTRYRDDDGNRVTAARKVTLAVPRELSLEFVDASERVIWRAVAE